MDFDTRYSTDEQCLEDLVRLRWPDGFVCPRCGKPGGWNMARGLVVCRSCRHQASPTSGTVFHRSRKPLRTWFRALWWIVAQKNGVSALGLMRVLGLGSYKTAWAWLHKFRRLMIIPGREKLSGVVEVDETYVGGKHPGKRGRGAEGKVLVVIGVEKTSWATGRVRMARIPSPSRRHLEKFILENVVPGSMVVTDGLSSYKGLATLGYEHAVEDETYSFDEGDILPNVHRIASLLKRWLLGTHQNFVQRNQLDYYLDEFTFRHNRRKAKSRGLLFKTILEQAVTHGPIHFAQIAGTDLQH